MTDDEFVLVSSLFKDQITLFPTNPKLKEEISSYAQDIINLEKRVQQKSVRELYVFDVAMQQTPVRYFAVDTRLKIWDSKVLQMMANNFRSSWLKYIFLPDT